MIGASYLRLAALVEVLIDVQSSKGVRHVTVDETGALSPLRLLLIRTT